MSETGTPGFLVDRLFERRVSTVSVGEMVGSGELLSAFDVEHIGTEALLFQTGCLTITGEDTRGDEALYRLGHPNREVRESLNHVLLRHLVQDAGQQTANSIRLARLLAVRTGGHVYLFEFKVVKMTPPGSALAQLRERRYADKYRGACEPIHLVGVEFSRNTRNVTACEVASG